MERKSKRSSPQVSQSNQSTQHELDQAIAQLSILASFQETTSLLLHLEYITFTPQQAQQLFQFFLSTSNANIREAWKTVETMKLLVGKYFEYLTPNIKEKIAVNFPKITGTENPTDVHLPSYLTSESVQIDYKHKLQTGGQATIYPGKYKNKDVIVKIVDFDDISKIKTVKETIFQEATLLQQFPEPFGATLYGVFLEEEKQNLLTIGFVMKKYENNLWDYLKENNESLTWNHKKEMIHQCLLCLQALHNFGILHTHIKAENFLVLQSEENVVPNVFITDFGFCDIHDYCTRYNASHSSFGIVHDRFKQTQIFCAPEILTTEEEQNAPFSKQSDIFSLGRVIGQIITCTIPYSHVTNEFHLQNHMAKGTNAFTQFPSDCPPLLSEIYHWCCNVDIQLRPTSCETVIQLLTQCSVEEEMESVWKKKTQIMDQIVTSNNK